MSHSGIGVRNRKAVLREIMLSGPVSRTEIAARVGLTAASLSRIVFGLLEEGLVREVPSSRVAGARPGRQRVPLEIDPGGGQVLGIGIGPAFQAVTLTDLKMQVIAGVELGLEALDDAERVIGRVAEESRNLIGRFVEDRSRLRGCFAMISGLVDPMSGTVLESPRMGWRNVPARQALADSLGFDMPVRVESLNAAIAHMERLFGAGRLRENMLLINCGLGLSASVIANGRLIRGHHAADGAIGAMRAVAENGAVEPLERLASGRAILRADARSTGCPNLSAALADAIGRERDGDPDLAVRVARAGRELGRAVAQFVPLVAPDIVVVSGPLARSGRYLEAVREGAADTVDVVAGAFADSVDGMSATCGLAICDYLFDIRTAGAEP